MASPWRLWETMYSWVPAGTIDTMAWAKEMGAVYLYDGATGQLLQTFANPAPGAWDAFGFAVAAHGDKTLVGTQFGNAAYLFEAIAFSPTAVTETDGNYRFDGLATGTYRIVPVREGYVQTGPGSSGTFTVDIDGEDHVFDLDFGWAQDELPVAQDDRYTMAEDGTFTKRMAEGVLGNDTDADGDRLTTTVVNQPPYGTLTMVSDGSFRYTPHENFAGSDSFTYRSHDGLAASNLATVTITIEPVNDAPIAHDDGLWVPMDTPRIVDEPGVMKDDVDVDGDPFTASTGRSASSRNGDARPEWPACLRALMSVTSARTFLPTSSRMGLTRQTSPVCSQRQ